MKRLDRRYLWLFLSVSLLLLESVPLLHTRWVEDESWYSIPADTLLKEGHLRNPTFSDSDYESKVDTRPPAMPLTLAASFKAFGTGVVQARLPSLAASLAVVLIAYLLGCELAGVQAGLLAALLAAVDNFLFLAARTVRPEALVTLFSGLALLFYLWSKRKQSTAIAFLSGLAAGVSLNYHVAALPMVATLTILFLVEFKYTFWKQPRVWAATVALILALIPFALWVRSTPTHYAAFLSMYGRGQAETWAEKLEAEETRYDDFIGLSSQRFGLPIRVPLRLPVAIVIVASVALLYRKNRQVLQTIAIVLLPNLIWWAYLVNKTSRYFAIIAPITAVLVGAAVCAKDIRLRSVWTKAFITLIILCTAGQIAGNGLFLYRARQADYERVGARLRDLIPQDQPVYGAITFWMVLRDRHYYSYDRTPFADARRVCTYFITNDRVMARGSGYGNDNWSQLRSEVETFVGTNAVLVGSVPNPFYGDLRIYRVKSVIPAP